MTEHHLKRRKDDNKAENLWELLSLLIRKPKNLIIAGILVIVIILFSNIQFTDVGVKVVITKVPLSKVIHAVEGVKHDKEAKQ